MIECVFTVDYEIYGNGQGSLDELVYEPGRRLKAIFEENSAKLVVFVEPLEFEKIEEAGTDKAIADVKRQIKGFHEAGHEIALHLHPQWCNARFESGRWLLDQTEYNLCPLGYERIATIVDQGLEYLRDILGAPDFTPLAFRAGNWLFQPTETAARVLAERGIRIDSSVFKGGMQHRHGLDYRKAIRNGDYWMFADDVNVADPSGHLLEMPIFTRMIPFWKMLTAKRVGLQRKSLTVRRSFQDRWCRILDLLRWQYPLKLDFCRMTLDEMIDLMKTIVRDNRRDPEQLRPVAAIGHTKDLVDPDTISEFLAYLKRERIRVSTFADLYGRCISALGRRSETRPLQTVEQSK